MRLTKFVGALTWRRAATFEGPVDWSKYYIRSLSRGTLRLKNVQMVRPLLRQRGRNFTHPSQPRTRHNRPTLVTVAGVYRNAHNDVINKRNRAEKHTQVQWTSRALHKRRMFCGEDYNQIHTWEYTYFLSACGISHKGPVIRGTKKIS